MILYLAQAYSKYECNENDGMFTSHPAYNLAILTTQKLWEMGFEVYSPIMYTHPFHLAMGKPKVDYVAHDLKLLESWLKNNGCSDVLDCIHCPQGNDCQNYDITKCKTETVYDTGVVCVFADDCFADTGNCVAEDCRHNSHEDKMFCYSCKRYWDSNGAKAEYDFAHQHYIKCIRLTELLENKQIDSCDPF